jgi:hypothetical protein
MIRSHVNRADSECSLFVCARLFDCPLCGSVVRIAHPGLQTRGQNSSIPPMIHNHLVLASLACPGQGRLTSPPMRERASSTQVTQWSHRARAKQVLSLPARTTWLVTALPGPDRKSSSSGSMPPPSIAIRNRSPRLHELPPVLVDALSEPKCMAGHSSCKQRLWMTSPEPRHVHRECAGAQPRRSIPTATVGGQVQADAQWTDRAWP